jgi:hypothetical protein
MMRRRAVDLFEPDVGAVGALNLLISSQMFDRPLAL